jgi:4-hydroxythreonine-4-phosphate dehydrogenase
MGEPAGIGPEVAAEAFRALGGRVGKHPLKLVGDGDLLRGLGLPDTALTATKGRATRDPGKPDALSAKAVIEAIEIAALTCMAGEASALVTAPINKAVLTKAGFGFPGHTEFLAHLTGTKRAVMMLAGPDLRVVPLTIHLPLAAVPGAITSSAIVETAGIVLEALSKDFGIANPRLVVAGLNPHAGESGVLGGEEARLIAPAIAELRERGFAVSGPHSADTLFHAEARARYDAALCMYHDQALIPIKTLGFWEAVNVTLGLPIVRTSPDHGTGFDIAGSGTADARSMIAAIKMAVDIADKRAV